MEKGLLTMIGKGSRSNEFVKELVNYGGVYLECIGGSAALIATKVKKMDMIAYPDLGAEAIYRLEVKDFPTLVSVDSRGHDLSKREISKYRNKLKIKEGKL
jgi:fumarate hydratase subunit beta